MSQEPAALRVRVRRLAHAVGLALPAPASPGSAGLDLRAAIGEEVVLGPGERRLVPTGLVLEMPEGFEAQVRPRSGLALRHGLILPNAPGTIDSDYRGEVAVILMNLGSEPVTLRRGDRVAQLVFAPVCRVEWLEAQDLPATARGPEGFGSSGRS